MFQKEEYVLHGMDGVCRVSDICPSPVGGEGEYYLLEPVEGSSNSKIYTPVVGGKIKMRRIMTETEAEELIDRIPFITTLPVENEKQRKEVYRAAMQTCDPTEYVRIIKTVYRRRVDLTAQKKKLPDADADTDRFARTCLYRELSLSLGIDYDQMEAYLISTINQKLEA